MARPSGAARRLRARVSRAASSAEGSPCTTRTWKIHGVAPGDEHEAERLGTGRGLHGEGDLLTLGKVHGGDDDQRAVIHRNELEALLVLGKLHGAKMQGRFEQDERGHASPYL